MKKNKKTIKVYCKNCYYYSHNYISFHGTNKLSIGTECYQTVLIKVKESYFEPEHNISRYIVPHSVNKYNNCHFYVEYKEKEKQNEKI